MPRIRAGAQVGKTIGVTEGGPCRLANKKGSGRTELHRDVEYKKGEGDTKNQFDASKYQHQRDRNTSTSLEFRFIKTLCSPLWQELQSLSFLHCLERLWNPAETLHSGALVLKG